MRSRHRYRIRWVLPMFQIQYDCHLRSCIPFLNLAHFLVAEICIFRWSFWCGIWYSLALVTVSLRLRCVSSMKKGWEKCYYRWVCFDVVSELLILVRDDIGAGVHGMKETIYSTLYNLDLLKPEQSRGYIRPGTDFTRSKSVVNINSDSSTPHINHSP